MLNLKSPLKPDFEQYERTIHADGARIFVDYQKYILSLNYFSGMFEATRIELANILGITSLGKYIEVTPHNVIQTLVRYCGLNERDLQVRKPDKQYVFSLDQTKILNPLKEKLDKRADTASESVRLASEIVDLYLKYKEYKTCMDNARAKLKRFSKSEFEGWSSELVTIDFMYEMKDTGRYYTKNDNIQTWNLNMAPSITVPKGYVLFWADFAQIDLRVAYHVFLKEPDTEYDKIYQEETDKYRAIYKIMCLSLGQSPDLELFTKYRPAFKKAILSAIYNAAKHSLAVDIKNSDLAESLYAYIHNNPGYKAFRERLQRVIDFGIEIPIRDYFGFNRVVPLTSNRDFWATNQLVSKGCNTPIQATSNGILMLWLESVLSGFEELGFNRDQHVIPYLIRHDEVLFMIHQSVLPYLWKFNEYMQIALDDWDLLTLEPHLGFFYKNPMPELEEQYLNQVHQHEKDYTPRTINTPRIPAYSPISDVMLVYTLTIEDPLKYLSYIDKTIVNADITSQEDAVAWLNSNLARDTHEDGLIHRWNNYAGKFVLYSYKWNKYICVSDLADIFDIAKKNEVVFIDLQNTTYTGSFIQDDIYCCANSFKGPIVVEVLSKMKECGWPDKWTALDLEVKI